MATREERLADLLVRWEEADSAGAKPAVATFCQDHACTDLILDFGAMVACFEPLRLIEATEVGLAGDVGGSPWAGDERYRVKGVLGRGGLGVVYLAEDAELGRDVAVKCLQPAAAQDESARERFEREAKLTGRLEHPGIVPVHGLARGAGGAYYTMRVIGGRSLHEAIERYHASDAERHVELRRLLRAFVTTCETMAYAHSRGVVHRDLKPNNIMVGDFGETLVIDWGLASAVGSEPMAVGEEEPSVLPTANCEMHTIAGRAMGTWGYMSPEQARGEWDRVGPASDIFSLGATLYHMLAGRPPYQGAQIPNDVLTGRFDPPSRHAAGVPKPLGAICLKAMQVDPGARYADARDLAADVERFLADEPVSAYRDPPAVRARRWAKRHRVLVTALLVLLLTAVPALAGGLFFVNEEKNRTATAQKRAETALGRVTVAQRRVRQALDATTEEAVERLMARQNKLTSTDRLFLNRMLGYYREFAADSGDDVEAQAGVANAAFRAGFILHRLGDHAEAETKYHAAADQYRRLAEESTDARAAAYRLEAARALNELAALLRSAGRLDEAERVYGQLEVELPGLEPQLAGDQAVRSRQLLGYVISGKARAHILAGRYEAAFDEFIAAAGIHGELRRKSPDPRHTSDLAAAEENAGLALVYLRRPDDAQRVLLMARDLYQGLVQQFPDETEYTAGLGRTLVTLGVEATYRLNQADALQILRDAVKVMRGVVRDYPSDAEYRSKLLAASWRLGFWLRTNPAARAEAEQSLREAVTLADRLIAESPNAVDARHGRGVAKANLGDLVSRDNPAEAARLYDGAAEDLEAVIRSGSRDLVNAMVMPWMLWNRATLAEKAGDYAALARTARRLRAHTASKAQGGLNAARFLARAAALAAADAKEAEARRKALADEYGRDAVAELKAAVAAGFKDAERLRGDAFAPLRERPDFQELVKGLERK